MPEYVEREDFAETETGFGTGLRAHLGRRLADEFDEAPVVEFSDPEPEPEPETEPEPFEEPVAKPEAHPVAVGPYPAFPVAGEAPPPAPASPDEFLRERLTENVERVWRAFDEALEALTPEGAPDFQARLQAASLLLAQAYAQDVGGPVADVTDVADQLADLRERKARHQLT